MFALLGRNGLREWLLLSAKIWGGDVFNVTKADAETETSCDQAASTATPSQRFFFRQKLTRTGPVVRRSASFDQIPDIHSRCCAIIEVSLILSPLAAGVWLRPHFGLTKWYYKVVAIRKAQSTFWPVRDRCG